MAYPRERLFIFVLVESKTIKQDVLLFILLMEGRNSPCKMDLKIPQGNPNRAENLS